MGDNLVPNGFAPELERPLMDGSRTAWELRVSPICLPNGPASARCLASQCCNRSIRGPGYAGSTEFDLVSRISGGQRKRTRFGWYQSGDWSGRLLDRFRHRRFFRRRRRCGSGSIGGVRYGLGDVDWCRTGLMRSHVAPSCDNRPDSARSSAR